MPSASPLLVALRRGGGSGVQRTLLALSLYRALGMKARLAVALQPAPRKPPARGSGGKPKAGRHAAPASDAPHLPVWIEVFVPASRRWASIDPSHEAGSASSHAPGPAPSRDSSQPLETPEALLGRVLRRLLGARARLAESRAYVVAVCAGEARDVTARYVSDLDACVKARTEAGWWEQTLRCAAAVGAARGAGGAREGASAAGASGAAAAEAEAEAADAAEAEAAEEAAEGEEGGRSEVPAWLYRGPPRAGHCR